MLVIAGWLVELYVEGAFVVAEKEFLQRWLFLVNRVEVYRARR